jgi:hypothetical protein
MGNKASLHELAFDSWQTGELIDYLANSFKNRSQSCHLGLNIAKGWANGKSSVHIHANLQIRGESESHEFCWVLVRDRMPGTQPCLDRLCISWGPSDTVDQSILVRNWPTNQDSSVLIVIGQSGYQCEHIMTRLQAIKLAVTPRLRFLNDCPCIPIDGYAVQEAPLLISLRRRFDFVNEIVLGLEYREAIGCLWFLAFPENQLPYEVVKNGTQINKEVPRNEGQMKGEFWEWIESHNVPNAVKAELDERGIGILLAQSPEFLIKRAKVFICPSEFGPNAGEVSKELIHWVILSLCARNLEHRKLPRDTRYLFRPRKRYSRF